MNVLMTGVGGQGIILASDVLTEVMMRYGLDVKKSEIHGMAQRGGSVMSHVRFAKHVSSPLISYGTCDILLSFEELETARYLPYINTESTVIINRFRLSPPAVIAGKEPYPDIVPFLREKAKDVRVVGGSALANDLGNPRGVNVILLGALSTLLEPAEPLWIETLNDMLPEKIRARNIEGFKQGRLLKTQ